ncbi:MAG: proprotein convertase P-domain-containing protein [Planctomycetota bacterium]|nr:proprotein convertase P-domain-containing protein [Planctomycetota bacterium]
MKSPLFVTVFLLTLTIPVLLMGQVSINEIRIDQSSTDNDEYFELSVPSGSSIASLTYLVIGDGTGGSGTIEAVVGLFGVPVPASGLFVAAESTFTIGIADLTTTLNFENSDNVTHMLVEGFTGTNGDDLDTNDDGVLDIEPWSAIIDSVALVETFDIPASGDHIYSATTIGPDGTFVPAHIVRCPDGNGSWEILPFADLGVPFDTPGASNSCPEVCDNGTDDDGDGDADCADADCAGDPSCAPPPANDNCADATNVVEGSYNLTTLGASTDGPTTCGGSMLNDVWLLYSATCSGIVVLTTCGTADFNPQMAIYPGTSACPPATGSELACDAGSCIGSGEPEIFLDAVAGQDYLIQFGGFNGERGNATITINCPPDDCHQFPNPNIELLGFVGTTASNAPGMPIDYAGNPPVGDFDFIDVTAAGTIGDLDVSVDISHTFIGNLDIDLVAPSQTQIRLYQNETNSDDDMLLTFDDEGEPYGSVTTYSGERMQPYDLDQGLGSLADFDGETAAGTWGIIIADTFDGTSGGTLNSWTLHIGQPQEIPDGTGSTDYVISVDPTDQTGINDLDVDIDISHGDTSDLEVDLLSPQGTSVRLHDHGAGIDLNGRYDDATGTNDGFGNLVPSGPGTLADFDGESIGGDWTLTVADTVTTNSGTINGWAIQVCPAQCNTPSDLFLTSDCSANSVTLSWTNNDTYDSIEIDRDGVALTTVNGADTSYIDNTVSDGFHDYTVRGICTVGAAAVSSFVDHFSYNGEDTIVVAMEGLFDGGDTGSNDSGAAIFAGLIAAGANAKLIRQQLDEYACINSPEVSQVWIACGTYPTDFNLSEEEAALIADLAAAGIGIYFESADHWSFNHPISSFDDRDGVAEPYEQDDDDQLTSLDGADSGVGLDMSGNQNVGYNQDNQTTVSGGNDFTNYLIPATAELAGGTAGTVWSYDDAIGNTAPNQGVTTAYVPDNGAPVICSSFELGGYLGDLNPVIAAYREFLAGGGTPPGSGFIRGDCNSDGGINIADAIFVLGNLFSGGPDGPCIDSCDANDDGALNIADAIYTLANLFSGGPNPPDPFPNCGPDPTDDPLGCDLYDACP